jgi:signal recognition particle subunit SRP54
MAGLQGSGKTTTCGKLAKLLLSRAKRPLLVAADLKRPAAIDQLEVIGGQVGVPVYVERDNQNAVKVCLHGIEEARRTDRDVVILDTAGRLAIDEDLMGELQRVAQATNPQQVYLVLDAMTGQDAVHTAKVFNEKLELDGVILTKFDSDTRGGAALSVKRVTGKPIKFVGVGEKLDAIEEFHPDRVAGRILGMGDILTLEDLMMQLRKMRQMGSLSEIAKKIPGMSEMIPEEGLDDQELVHLEAIVQSMTPKERANPKLIDTSRRRRIAKGAGVDPTDVSGLVKQFEPMRQMMKMMSGQSFLKRLKMGSAFSQMMASGKMPNFKGGSTASKRVLSRKDKRKKRR